MVARTDVVLGQEHRVEAWLHCALGGPDQLRQRVAFALSEILVVSMDSSALVRRHSGMAWYYDLLAQNAFGNFRDLLEAVTLSPAMGGYLSMYQNRKANPALGTRADENFAREVMQLFTIGLQELNADGTPRLDDSGAPIPTYAQDDVENLARVFTGWSLPGGFTTTKAVWTQPMTPYEAYHDTDSKVIVGGVRVPAGLAARAELKIALDTLFSHPNVGPFIGRQLIQRLVTSNPSPAYVARVAAAFNDNGSGQRGDLFAVTRAVLLDPEARNPAQAPNYGKLREPLLRLTQLWRAFGATAPNGHYDVLGLATSLTQSPLRAPSVFNFFRPDYRPPGALEQAGLVAPEFQITNETTLTTAVNFLQLQAQHYRDAAGTASAGTRTTDVALQLAPWSERALQPGAMLDDLNVLLMSGQMDAASWQALLADVQTVPATTPLARVSEAVQLIVTSPQYAIQR